jgi:hypothetical protein
MKTELPDFSKKLVSFSVRGENDGRAIDRPRWEIQGGRLFLVGTVPRGGSSRDWCEGVTSAVAWDEVTDYLVFDSVKHYRKRLAVYDGKKQKR